MLVLTGELTGRKVAALEALGWGRMYIRRPVRPYAGEPWALDNGAYALTMQTGGLEPAAERAWVAAYLARVRDLHAAGLVPLFAVVPDAPFAGDCSLDLSVSTLDACRTAAPSWRWLVAVQDGMEPGAGPLPMTRADVLEVLAGFDGVFVGGSDAFKRDTAALWASLAHDRGGWCHYGRASTPRKLLEAHRAGCDSADSAFMLWTAARFAAYADAWATLPGTDPAAARFAATLNPLRLEL